MTADTAFDSYIADTLAKSHRTPTAKENFLSLCNSLRNGEYGGDLIVYRNIKGALASLPDRAARRAALAAAIEPGSPTLDLADSSQDLYLSRLVPGTFGFQSSLDDVRAQLVWTFVNTGSLEIRHDDFIPFETNAYADPEDIEPVESLYTAPCLHQLPNGKLRRRLAFEIDLETAHTVDDIRSLIARIAKRVAITNGIGPGWFARAHYDTHRAGLLDLIAALA